MPLRQGLSHREPDLETCVAGLRTQLNISAVLLNNALDRVEAQARAFPNSFGREKRFEDVGLYLFRNSWTVVANLDYYATVIAIGSDAKFALAVHRVNRVIDNVGPDLVEFASKRIYEEGNALVVTLHHDSLFQLVVQDRKRGLQALYHVYVLDRRLVHVGVFLDCADQIRYPRGAALDFVYQTCDLHRGGDPDQSSSSGVPPETGKQRFNHLRLDV